MPASSAKDRPGVSYLTGRLLEEGTRKRMALQLAARRDRGRGRDDGGQLGVHLAAYPRRGPSPGELLADLVRQPVFPDGAVEWAKQRILAELQNDREDPACQADLIFRGLVYGAAPAGSRSRKPARCPAADSRRCGRAPPPVFLWPPDRAFLVAVGDFEPRNAGAGQDPLRFLVPGGETPVPLPSLQEPGKVAGCAGSSVPASRFT